MSDEIRSRKLPFWATFLTLLGVGVLCALGTWQIERLAWKNDLIAKLEAAYNTQSPDEIVFENKHPEFSYVRVSGRLLSEKAFLLGPPYIRDEKPGLDLVVPVETQGRVVLVNMGWTPHGLVDQPIYHLSGEQVSFYGALKYPSWNMFTPANQPERNVWYRLDREDVAQAKGLDNIYAAYLRADRSDHKFDGAFFGDLENDRQIPNNNHLHYAIFWYVMAGMLVVIYVFRFILKRTV